MRVIVATFIGLAALGAPSVQAAPSPDMENWVQLGVAPSFELGGSRLPGRLESGPLARLAGRLGAGVPASRIVDLVAA
jgi:hypothetical protein